MVRLLMVAGTLKVGAVRPVKGSAGTPGILTGEVRTMGVGAATGMVDVVVEVVVTADVPAELIAVISATGITDASAIRATIDRSPRLVRTLFMMYLSHCSRPPRQFRDFGLGHSALNCSVVLVSPSDQSSDSRSRLRLLRVQLFGDSLIQ